MNLRNILTTILVTITLASSAQDCCHSNLDKVFPLYCAAYTLEGETSLSYQLTSVEYVDIKGNRLYRRTGVYYHETTNKVKRLKSLSIEELKTCSLVLDRGTSDELIWWMPNINYYLEQGNLSPTVRLSNGMIAILRLEPIPKKN